MIVKYQDVCDVKIQILNPYTLMPLHIRVI